MKVRLAVRSLKKLSEAGIVVHSIMSNVLHLTRGCAPKLMEQLWTTVQFTLQFHINNLDSGKGLWSGLTKYPLYTVREER